MFARTPPTRSVSMNSDLILRLTKLGVDGNVLKKDLTLLSAENLNAIFSRLFTEFDESLGWDTKQLPGELGLGEAISNLKLMRLDHHVAFVEQLQPRSPRNARRIVSAIDGLVTRIEQKNSSSAVEQHKENELDDNPFASSKGLMRTPVTTRVSKAPGTENTIPSGTGLPRTPIQQQHSVRRSSRRRSKSASGRMEVASPKIDTLVAPRSRSKSIMEQQHPRIRDIIEGETGRIVSPVTRSMARAAQGPLQGSTLARTPPVPLSARTPPKKPPQGRQLARTPVKKTPAPPQGRQLARTPVKATPAPSSTVRRSMATQTPGAGRVPNADEKRVAALVEVAVVAQDVDGKMVNTATSPDNESPMHDTRMSLADLAAREPPTTASTVRHRSRLFPLESEYEVDDQTMEFTKVGGGLISSQLMTPSNGLMITATPSNRIVRPVFDIDDDTMEMTKVVPGSLIHSVNQTEPVLNASQPERRAGEKLARTPVVSRLAQSQPVRLADRLVDEDDTMEMTKVVPGSLILSVNQTVSESIVPDAQAVNRMDNDDAMEMTKVVPGSLIHSVNQTAEPQVVPNGLNASQPERRAGEKLARTPVVSRLAQSQPVRLADRLVDEDDTMEMTKVVPGSLIHSVNQTEPVLNAEHELDRTPVVNHIPSVAELPALPEQLNKPMRRPGEKLARTPVAARSVSKEASPVPDMHEMWMDDGNDFDQATPEIARPVRNAGEKIARTPVATRPAVVDSTTPNDTVSASTPSFDHLPTDDRIFMRHKTRVERLEQLTRELEVAERQLKAVQSREEQIGFQVGKVEGDLAIAQKESNAVVELTSQVGSGSTAALQGRVKQTKEMIETIQQSLAQKEAQLEDESRRLDMALNQAQSSQQQIQAKLDKQEEDLESIKQDFEQRLVELDTDAEVVVRKQLTQLRERHRKLVMVSQQKQGDKRDVRRVKRVMERVRMFIHRQKVLFY